VNEGRLFYGGLAVFGVAEVVGTAARLAGGDRSAVAFATFLAAAVVLVAGAAGLYRGDEAVGVSRWVVYLVVVAAAVSVVGVALDLAGAG